jgi:lipoprotein-releasing system ATP-binding protein
MAKLLEVVDLHKSYGAGAEEIHVLRGITMEVQEGERWAIVGESGVGKSTLLHILGALDRPTVGRVTYRGRDLSELRGEPLAEFRNREAGFVFQFHYLLPDFSALENVMLPALIGGWDGARARQEAGKLLQAVGLEERATHRPGKLSGGEQQRVAVARALIMSPSLVLADEPTGDLDLRTGDEIGELLLKFNRERGVALIVATHNRQLAAKMGFLRELKEGKLFAL